MILKSVIILFITPYEIRNIILSTDNSILRKNINSNNIIRN